MNNLFWSFPQTNNFYPQHYQQFEYFLNKKKPEDNHSL